MLEQIVQHASCGVYLYLIVNFLKYSDILKSDIMFPILQKNLFYHSAHK